MRITENSIKFSKLINTIVKYNIPVPDRLFDSYFTIFMFYCVLDDKNFRIVDLHNIVTYINPRYILYHTIIDFIFILRDIILKYMYFMIFHWIFNFYIFSICFVFLLYSTFFMKFCKFWSLILFTRMWYFNMKMKNFLPKGSYTTWS